MRPYLIETLLICVLIFPFNLRGFVNFRATYNAGAERVYGAHCHAGDTVGVLLDCDAGRISYFVDGVKYGEHILNDLGCAFENLSPFGFNADGCGSGGAGQASFRSQTLLFVTGFIPNQAHHCLSFSLSTMVFRERLAESMVEEVGGIQPTELFVRRRCGQSLD